MEKSKEWSTWETYEINVEEIFEKFGIKTKDWERQELSIEDGRILKLVQFKNIKVK